MQNTGGPEGPLGGSAVSHRWWMADGAAAAEGGEVRAMQPARAPPALAEAFSLLQDKAQPLCERSDGAGEGGEEAKDESCLRCRGTVDVSRLQAVLSVLGQVQVQVQVQEEGQGPEEETCGELMEVEGKEERKSDSASSRRFHFWDGAEHEASNVSLHRPAHDRWGIQKAVFVYCDDFLQRVFQFPWWDAPIGELATLSDAQKRCLGELEEADGKPLTWRELIDPAFRVCGITDPDRQVVRCLLARLPPGGVIPVHHDTGYWVRHTHRVHVPLVTDADKVVFQVGPTEERMRRYLFEEGSVVELNNQSKHAVENLWDQHRVHLIFDYVEEHPVRLHRLAPGTVLHQTRRSIDLEEDKGSRPTPTFVIIGAQKSGTTSLFEYLMQHPLVIKPERDRRESHCFDWRWNPNLHSTAQQRAYYMQFFRHNALQRYPSLHTGESTPSYLLHGDLVIPRISAVCPKTRFIVMLRDPCLRAYSQFQMIRDPEGTPQQKKTRGASEYVNLTFEEVVARELDQLEQCGIHPQSTYAEFRDRFLPTCPMNHGGHSLLARGLYALQLEPWIDAFGPPVFLHDIAAVDCSLFGDANDSEDVSTAAAASAQGSPPHPPPPPSPSARSQTSSDSRLLVVRTEEVSSIVRLRDSLPRIFQFLEIPPWPDIEDCGRKNTRNYTPMQPETEARLRAFYAPFNQRLEAMLGITFDWPVS